MKGKLAFSSLAVLAFLAPATAMAQTQPTPPAAAPDARADDQSGDIIVTAQKKSESLQKVPAAITAVDGSALTRYGTSTLLQLPALVPSLQITPVRNQAQIYLRGVGQTLTSPNADPAIAVNINGVNVPNEMTAGFFFDIDRVEVLPGPQGTLYGRSATGGVINLITRRPGSEFSADGFVEVGDYSRVQAFAGVNVPVSNTFAVRAAMTVLKHDGYDSNGGDDQDSYAGRLTGVWRPGDATTVTGIVSYAHDGGIGAFNVNIPPTYDPSNPRVLGFDARAMGLSLDFKSTTASLEVKHDFSNDVTLTYFGGFNKFDGFQRTVFYAGPPPVPQTANLGTKSTTHELRLNANLGRLSIVGGLYYFWSRSYYTVQVSPNATTTIVNGLFIAKGDGEAAFGQLTYAVTDSLRLTAGGRYSRTNKELNGTNSTITATTTVVPYAGTKNLDRVDWKGGFEFDVAPGSMLYGNVSTGFTPGGLSTAPAVNGQPEAATFAPVFLTAYTGGIKNRFFDNRLTINLEGFYYDYKNYQVSVRNPQTGQNIVYNADKAEIYGVQADTRLQLSRNDELSVNVAWLHAKAVTLITPAGNFAGFDLPYSPHWTVNTSYRHTFDLGSSGSVDASVNFQYVAGRWAFYTHATGTYIGDNTKTDLDLTYRPASKKWGLGLWVRNLEDKDVQLGGVSGAVPGPAAFGLAPPRTFGGRFSFNL